MSRETKSGLLSLSVLITSIAVLVTVMRFVLPEDWTIAAVLVFLAALGFSTGLFLVAMVLDWFHPDMEDD